MIVNNVEELFNLLDESEGVIKFDGLDAAISEGVGIGAGVALVLGTLGAVVPVRTAAALPARYER